MSNPTEPITSSSAISIVLNGENKHVPAGLTVTELLNELQIEPSRVAIEFNGEILRQNLWTTTRVEDEARLEVVWFVGGG